MIEIDVEQINRLDRSLQMMYDLNTSATWIYATAQNPGQWSEVFFRLAMMASNKDSFDLCIVAMRTALNRWEVPEDIFDTIKARHPRVFGNKPFQISWGFFWEELKEIESYYI